MRFRHSKPFLHRSTIGKRPRPTTTALPSLPLYKRQLHCHCHSWANQQNASNGSGSTGIGDFANQNNDAIVGTLSYARGVRRDWCVRPINPQQRLRPFSSDSFNASNSAKQSNNTEAVKTTSDNAVDVSNTSTSQSPSPTKSVAKTPGQSPPKKRRRRRSSSALRSPTARNAHTHPKSTAVFLTPSDSERRVALTRKQILRLTPKQRRNLRNAQAREYENSRTHLDRARTNLRSNLQYLGDAADGNFKQNVKTIRRLFDGEEVWKDADKSGKPQEEESLAPGIDWERAPAEIQANLRRNLSQTQNYLHEVTGGLVPSSAYVGKNAADGELARSGSVATRVQQFHEMKQSNRLVMDRTWFAKNIALALLPGLLLNLYFQSRQEEMIGYYREMERKEREKILGLTGGDGVGSHSDGGAESGGMGLSSAMIPEGGSVWGRLKMTANDLFLGGAEARINEQREAQVRREAKIADADTNESVSSAGSAPKDTAGIPDSITDATAAAEANDSENDDGDATIQMLLDRVRALEKQLGSDNDDDTATSSEEESRKQHELEYQIKRIKQSPIQNRRDDSLLAKWRSEETKNEGEERKGGVAEGGGGGAAPSDSPYSFADVVDFARGQLEPISESAKEAAMRKVEDAMSAFGFSAGERLADTEDDSEEEKVILSPAAVDIRTDAGSTSKPILPSNDTMTGEVVGPALIVKSLEIADPDSQEVNNEVENGHAQPDATQSSKRSGFRKWVGAMWKRLPKLREQSLSESADVIDRSDKKEE